MHDITVRADYPPNVTEDVEHAHLVENAQHLAQGLVDRGYVNVSVEVDGSDVSVARSQTPPPDLEPTDEAAATKK